MSKIFYDEYIDFNELHFHIQAVVEDDLEKQDLWQLVDEFVHLKMVEIILENLHEELHDEFLSLYREKPYDDSIVSYLNENMAIKFPILVENEMEYIKKELLDQFGVEQKKPLKKMKVKKSKKST